MKLLTIQSVTQEALKILNRSFNDSYAKQYRAQIGGNEYIHQANKPNGSYETPTGFNQTRPSRDE